jgi:hypothetical protein
MKNVVQIRTVPRPRPSLKSWETGEPVGRTGGAKVAPERSASGAIFWRTSAILAGSVFEAAR